MDLVRDVRSPARWTVRLLALACVLLGVMCLALAVAWSNKAGEAACYREALKAGETPAVADTDCGGQQDRKPRRHSGIQGQGAARACAPLQPSHNSKMLHAQHHRT